MWQEVEGGVWAAMKQRYVIYQCVAPWSRLEYLGETRLTLPERVITHYNAVKNYELSNGVYDYFRKFGFGVGLWLPVKVWAPRYKPSKAERLFAEGALVWERQPRFNQVGIRLNQREADRYGSQLVLSRRKKSRKLLRFRRSVRVSEESVAPKRLPEARQDEEFRKRMVMMRLVVVLARRPLKVSVGFDALRTVQAVRSQPLRKLQILLHLGQRVLQDVPRSIFWANVHWIFGRGRQSSFSLQ